MTKRWMVLLGLAGLFFWGSVSASAATYYIDYAGGNDGNSGTSKTSAWQHAPGMKGCAANCASTTPVPGDSIIFKGGVTWPASVFTWTIPSSGTAGNPIYYGVDKTYYTGSAWERPIFDDGGTGNKMLAMGYFGLNYVTIDDFEWKNWSWTGNAGPTSGVIGLAASTYVTVENNYFHGWSHGTSAAGTTDGCVIIDGYGNGPAGLGTHISYNVFDGSDSTNGGDSCYATYHMEDHDHNYVHNLSNGFVLNAAAHIYDNTIGPINQSFDVVDHENCLELNEGFRSSGPYTSYIYNNVIYDCRAETIIGENGTDVYVWNNLMYQSGSQTLAGLMSIGSGWQVHAFNNILDNRNNSAENGCILDGGGGTLLDLRNNFCINSHNEFYDLAGTASANIVCDSVGATCGNWVMTPSEATAAGITQSETYIDQPLDATCTGKSGCPVGNGLNLSSLATGDLATLANDTTYGVGYDAANHTVATSSYTSTARPSTGAWDAGAYNFSSAASTQQSSAPAPPSGLKATVQ
jgi:hypothetical protein